MVSRPMPSSTSTRSLATLAVESEPLMLREFPAPSTDAPDMGTTDTDTDTDMVLMDMVPTDMVPTDMGPMDKVTDMVPMDMVPMLMGPTVPMDTDNHTGIKKLIY